VFPPDLERSLNKHTVEISRDPAHVSLRNEQLLLRREGEVVGSVPCDDIGVLLVDHPQTTYTHAALARLAESDAAVIICGHDRLPAAMVLPFARHSQVVQRLYKQLAVSRPLTKQLWKQIVVAKVQAQARNIPASEPAHRKLLALALEVRSGDPQNIEAQAAKIYWANWLWQEEFRRDSDGVGLNSFLNYGYAVIRAATARAIVAAGLLPSLGIHHCHRSNAFCLADDLIEPIRPIIDDRVREMHRQGYEELNQSAKKMLLEVLDQQLEISGEGRPLMVALHRMVASLVHCFEGQTKRLEIPISINDVGSV
jgi:CRISPR-associated protein Cas1